MYVVSNKWSGSSPFFQHFSLGLHVAIKKCQDLARDDKFFFVLMSYSCI